MKKFQIVLFFFLALSSSLFSDVNNGEENEIMQEAPELEQTGCIDGYKLILETKLGYFIFASNVMRKVYDRGGIDVQLSASYPLWRWFQIYGSVEYLTRWGKSLGSREKTNLWEVPLSLGLKPVWSIHPKIQYYFTIGPRYVFIHTHNKSPYVDKNLSQNGFGGFANTGFNFFPWQHLCIDIFAEYFYAKIHFHPSTENVFGRDIQVGGFTFGLGGGYAF